MPGQSHEILVRQPPIASALPEADPAFFGTLSAGQPGAGCPAGAGDGRDRFYRVQWGPAAGLVGPRQLSAAVSIPLCARVVAQLAHLPGHGGAAAAGGSTRDGAVAPTPPAAVWPLPRGRLSADHHPRGLCWPKMYIRSISMSNNLIV